MQASLGFPTTGASGRSLLLVSKPGNRTSAKGGALVQSLMTGTTCHFGGVDHVADTVAAKTSPVMTCLELALTAQLICVSGQTIVCTDNSSIAQLLGVPACTITERSRSNDDYRRIQAQRDKPLR